MESVKSFKRKMLLWTSNWSQEDYRSNEEIPFTPDAVEIASLLQATGFCIRFMDQCLPEEMHPVPGVPSDQPACRVIIMCPRSGIRMELDARTSACKCPLPNSGVGRYSDQTTKTVDSLVPKGSLEISKTVSELIGGLFHVMSLFPDQNHNDIKSAPYSGSTISSPMKTPATAGIAIVTPNAPCGPKASDDEESKSAIPGRYRSLDTLISSGGLPDDLPEPGQLTPKDDHQETHMEVDGEMDATYTRGLGSATKKFLSKSSPAVNCSEMFRESTTFMFGEDNDDDNTTTVKKKKSKTKLLRTDTFEVPNCDDNNLEEDESCRIVPLPKISQSFILLSKLNQVQLCISDMIHMVADNEDDVSNIGIISKASKVVNEVAQQRIADRVRPIRCLSDFGSVPNLSRTAGGTAIRSIPRPKIRRHTPMISVPATPTTSRRRGPTTTTTAVDRIKNKGASTTQKIGSNKVAPNSCSSLQKMNESQSSTTSLKSNEPISNAIPNRRATIHNSCIPKIKTSSTQN